MLLDVVRPAGMEVNVISSGISSARTALSLGSLEISRPLFLSGCPLLGATDRVEGPSLLGDVTESNSRPLICVAGKSCATDACVGLGEDRVRKDVRIHALLYITGILLRKVSLVRTCSTWLSFLIT